MQVWRDSWHYDLQNVSIITLVIVCIYTLIRLGVQKFVISSDILASINSTYFA